VSERERRTERKRAREREKVRKKENIKRKTVLESSIWHVMLILKYTSLS
jgi:hypothetical protein